MPGPERFPAWNELSALARVPQTDTAPAAPWMISAAGLTVDFTKQLLDESVVRALLALAH
jgi:hypothetical protein